MRRETQNILLLLLGGALLKIALTGDYLRYVKPAHQPWLLGAGAVTVLLGAVAIVRDVLAARERPGTLLPGHEHDHPARSAWLLMVPVLAVFLVAPPALGSDSVTRTRSGSTAGFASASFPPLPPGDPLRMTLTDFVSRAGWDEAGSVDGRRVTLTGFVVHNEGETWLARMVIGCCAADGYPVQVQLDGDQADELAADTWLEVTGEVVPDVNTAEAGYVPEFTVGTLRQVPAPRDPYEY
ncbi:TIGR03943 family putative permease subunit [Prauserella cavernicola]|uniref:TIGR03943 family protein n=1 Tax=Prauserella cavernicola TaxID=2800127 RepID=A0A934QWG1_9PSEU|nr:TIGR03943 family protein [Prauserella cavernicola]MBK1786569.1 TIGR03943 family protein [Prauserella cavernicola]